MRKNRKMGSYYNYNNVNMLISIITITFYPLLFKMTDIKENTSWQGDSMDREIEFIARDTYNNKFIEIENIQIAKNNKPTSINDWQYQIQSNWQIILLQYTGLKDKNWVDIYEGDIVNIEDQDYTDKTLWIIQRAQGGFDIDRTMYWKNRWWHNLYFLSPYLMVVWNIYQNPELLSEK